MRIRNRQKIVVLGMMGRMPVGGAEWQALHYLIGFERLGYEAYYVEAHGCISWAFGEDEARIAAFIDGVMHRFDMGDRWAFHARSGSGSYYGKSRQQVKEIYDSAAAIFNLHGGTIPTDELSTSKRLVYIDTDPVAVQIEIHNGLQSTVDFLNQHCAFFTFGENYSNTDCLLPVSDRFTFSPTRQPVVLDFWNSPNPGGTAFTTIGNWEQLRRVVEYEGTEYYWSKHFEFLKFLDLPGQSNETFELALSGCDETSRNLLQEHGWRVRDALTFSRDLDAYRDYIWASRGEFTVAKEQNIHFRTGWFSDRSATYLAAGRPVITQETGFSNVLPVGDGLFGFSTAAEILGAIDSINSNYERHQRSAIAISRDYFSHDVVLTSLLSTLGIEPERSQTGAAPHKPAGTLPGVNIIGYLGSGTGVGELSRRYANALETIGCPLNIVDLSTPLPPNTSICTGEINLICCDIDSYFSLRERLGEDLFRDRYNIGIWSWELTSFPEKWHDRFAYFDEIWTPTSFIASAVSPVSPIPVLTMTPDLTTEPKGNRKAGRKRFGLADGEYVFTFIFNFHSRVQRKNPLAVIDAFQKAFCPDEPARLLIKCANAAFNRDHLLEMQQRSKDGRVFIYDGDWSAEEMRDLTAATDCYVSLHRAEGVGLTISDAMAAGKPVIATGWSGNMDFMSIRNSFPVRYQLSPLQEDVTHYRKADVWAEPSLNHAAELMRHVFEQRAEANGRGEAARRDIAANYSVEVSGKALAKRLGVIAKHHQFRSLQQALGAGTPGQQVIEEFSDLGTYVPMQHLQYSRLKAELQRVVRTHVPRTAVLLIVAKGDDNLLNLYDCKAWHFPSDSNHSYAGHHPKDSAEAISFLDSLRSEGGISFSSRNPSFWWLEHYTEFRQHLETRYSVVHRDEACHIFDVSENRQGWQS